MLPGLEWAAGGPGAWLGAWVPAPVGDWWWESPGLLASLLFSSISSACKQGSISHLQDLLQTQWLV